ncbi:exporter of polyketide antibiotics [Georgenia halophila]|uniref:Exporter of polyketide antibiotics n=1 Tax=Georgenia halophila TaxID=620889 RepID=A0ABP8LEC8_9MICO
MSAATTTAPRTTAGAEKRTSSLTGTGTLLRFMLRRDRIRFPAWALGMTLMMAYFGNLLPEVWTQEALEGFVAGVGASPFMALLGGPGFGFDAITLPRFMVDLYGLYLLLFGALMGILTVSRHTRVEEQSGRAELIRASVVGRHAQLTAALTMAVLLSLVTGVLMGVALAFSAMEPEPMSSAFLFAMAVAACSIAFAGVAAVTAQLSPFSRAASGMAGAVLGLAYVLRGLGDMSRLQDGPLAWLSWLSPIGWSQQVAAFVEDRWWPLGLSLLFAAALAASAYWLESRRDLGAGLIAARGGSPRAAGWLGSPLGLAFRLQRSSLIGWSIVMVVTGVTYGAFGQLMVEGFDDAPDIMLEMMGGEVNLLNGYMGLMGLMYAIVIAVFAILSVQALRGEEYSLHTEPVLATAVGRPAWLLSWTSVTALGALWLLFLAGLGDATGAAVATGRGDLFWPVLLGHVAHTPAVWLLLAVAVVLYGAVPRLVGLVWLLFAYGAFMSFFGGTLDMPEAALDLSPFAHIGQHPLEDISWGAVAVLTAAAAVLIAAAAAAFRRRDLITA